MPLLWPSGLHRHARLQVDSPDTGRHVYGLGPSSARHQGYEIRVRPADSAVADDDLDISLTAMNASIEHLIDESPSQYLWSYKRFRRPPAGVDTPYQA